MRSHDRSKELFAEALKVMPGGVNSPVRAFGGVGGDPIVMRKAKGAVLADVDGNEYVDFVSSWGPLILGHAPETVVKAVCEAAARGTSFGAPTEAETTLARKICEHVPSIERVRLVSSGTEATMSAIRLARGYTGRDLVIKCEGCYHGHVDGLLVQAGSGLTTFGAPNSPGIPAAQAEQTLLVPFNDADALKTVCEERGEDVACFILEPVAGNMGVIPPAEGYLQAIREITQRYGIVLIFDEVITGFRVGLGGAQSRYGVTPDLTTLGKIIGGGLPVGAYGGRADIMAELSPEGPVYQAGTLSGNPLATVAGLAAVEALEQPGVYDKLEALGAQLAQGLAQAAKDAGVPVRSNRVGSMMTIFFTEEPVTDYATAKRSNADRYAAYFHAMLERGFYFAPSQFEAAFVSLAHTPEQIEACANAASESMKKVANAG